VSTRIHTHGRGREIGVVVKDDMVMRVTGRRIVNGVPSSFLNGRYVGVCGVIKLKMSSRTISEAEVQFH
jgi:hypothetical protein